MRSYIQALYVAAQEAYESEVVQPDMEWSIIGESGDYDSKAEWIEARVAYWLEEAEAGNLDRDLKHAYSVYWYDENRLIRWSIVFGVNEGDATLSLKQKVGQASIMSVVKYDEI